MPNLDDELHGLIDKLTHDVDEPSTVDAIWEKTARRRRGHQVKRIGLIAVAAAIAVASFVPLSSAFRKNHVVSAPSPHPTSAPPTGSPFGPSPTPTPPPLPAFDVKGTLVLTNGQMSRDLFTATGRSAPKRVPVPYVRPNAFGGSLSPDGTRVALVASDFMPVDPQNDLMIVDMTTRRVTRIAWLTPYGDTIPSWSPRGDMLAFLNYLGTIDNAYLGIYVTRPDGTLVRRLTWETLGNCQNSGMTWSPDGSQLAYGRNCWRNKYNIATLHIIAVDGSSDHQILKFENRNASVGAPSFSPDGKTLAFEGPRGVYLVGIDGSDLHLIAPGASCPIWSPDGQAIAVGGRSDVSGVKFLDPRGTPVGAIPKTAGKWGFCPISWYAN